MKKYITLSIVGLVGVSTLFLTGCVTGGGAANGSAGKPITLAEFTANAGTGTAEEQYERLISFLAWPRNQFLGAQADIYNAIGKKDLAALYQAEADAMSSGSVTLKDIKTSIAKTAEAEKAAGDAISKATPLTEEGKALYKQGMKKMYKGIAGEAAVMASTVALAAITVDEVNKLQAELKGANPLQAAKLTKRLSKVTAAAGGTAYLVKQIPGDVKAGVKTYGLARQFGKKNQIETEDINISDLL